LERKWDQFNARSLSPEKVAETFVASQQYSEICVAQSTLLVGSRGSGKTTLLRMLEPQAQAAWLTGSEGRVGTNAIGIFVPVDASWLASLRNSCANLEDPSEWENVSLCVYSLTVARSIVDVIIYRTTRALAAGNRFQILLNDEDEQRYVEVLSRLYCIEGARTLLSFRFRIATELAMIPSDARTMEPGRREALFSKLGDPVSLASTACDLFNQISHESERQWFLLCDEIEIAPPTVQRALIGAMRATPSPLFLKLAMTPVVRHLQKEIQELPLPTHDFGLISLSHSSTDLAKERVEREDFCSAIWRQLAPAESNGLIDPFVVLVEPDVYRQSRRRGMGAIRSGQKIRQYESLFSALSSKDASFAKYLTEKGVDPSNLSDCPPEILDAVVRKVVPLAEVRLFHRTSGGRQQRVSRRSMPLYAGAHRIFQISETHPRWLKSTLGALIGAITSDGKISVGAQAAELLRSVERLNARIAALPCIGPADTSAQRVVEKIGRYFSNEVLSPQFKADPYLSFIVDDDIRPEVISSIESALYIGALVPIGLEDGGLLRDGVVGNRFRLSYWLAPYFKLPLLVGKPIRLSRVLGDDGVTEIEQLELGDGW
jgi:hypothetical protein